MDELQSNEGSGYINVDLQPPSPRTAPIDSLYDFGHAGSPYSDHSELSFTDNQLAPIFDPYDPNDYDAPNSANSLLMFTDYYRSPSPSGSDNNDDRASSASSTHTTFHSPHMGVAQSFEALTFSSPNWHTESLPPHKAPSPPRLQIDQQPPIIINVPEDNTNNHPSLHIVPATPVSGGGDGVVNIASSSHWLEPHSDVSSRSPSPSHSAATTPGTSRSPSASPQPPSSPFLFPQQPRLRSKSDTALQPPNWDTITATEGLIQQQQQEQQVYPPTLGSNFTFGTPSQQPQDDYLSPNPTFEFAGAAQLRRSRSDIGNPPLNRHRGSRSEDFRFSTSQDTNNAFLNPANAPSTSNSAGLLFPPTSHADFLRQQLAQQQFLSPNNARVSDLIPSHPHQPTHHHSASLGSQPQPQRGHGHGHYRTTSGGSRPRSERGSSAGAGWEGELNVNSARASASPYPSPHASPRGRIQPLDRADDQFDFTAIESGSQNGAGMMNDGGGGGGLGLVNTGPPAQGKIKGPIVVSKPNVTTGRTANASQRRRKQEATFVCPVPGCGSTFTRSFNLKGHIRSHNEEKPFRCPWPGCGKGFARQHDCKRHEQLHTNYRPFSCDGCGKQFARMDALNRHLKSEGGAECSKQLEGASPPDSAASNSSTNGNTTTKSPPSQQYAQQQQQQQYGGGGGGGGGGTTKIKVDEAWGVGLSVAM